MRALRLYGGRSGGVLVAEHRHLDLLGQLLGRHPAHVRGVRVVVVAPHPELLNLAPVRRLPAGERVVPDAYKVIDLRVEALLLLCYAGSTMGMSMLRFFGLKLMPTSVTGRGPPIHLSA